MIKFKTIRWTNFMSYGNTWTKLNLDTHRTTLIVGKNGSGKSTFLDALSFVLYGKAFRPIKKDQMINSITNKKTLVEVEFDTNGYSYMVRRGIKPNVFQIWRNGIMLDQDSHSRDTQEMLETSILKLNHKSFSQIIVLGLANYVPFMRLPAAHRRAVIEDLLDIQIFSVMNSLLKDKVNQCKLDLQTNDSEVTLAETKIEMHLDYLKELSANHKELVKNLQKKVRDEKIKCNEAIERANKHREALEKLKKRTSNQADNQTQMHRIMSLECQFEEKLKDVEEEIRFYDHNDECPTCQQTIDPEHKEKILESILKPKEDKLKNGLFDVKTKLAVCIEKDEEYSHISAFITDEQDKIDNEGNIFRAGKRMIEGYEDEISELEAKHKKSKENGGKLDELKENLTKAQKARDAIVKHKDILFVAGSLLKDGGIKGKIIKQYVPILNSLINTYLQKLDFFVEFHIDEQFNETIKSRYRDEFSYESFSQGEKLRIDLSLMFTWRAVAKLRNSTTTNLLILDEILDSSLDTTGVEDFIQIIKELTKGTNTFIISHKLDNMEEFDRILRFEKKENFSRLAT